MGSVKAPTGIRSYASSPRRPTAHVSCRAGTVLSGCLTKQLHCSAGRGWAGGGDHFHGVNLEHRAGSSKGRADGSGDFDLMVQMRCNHFLVAFQAIPHHRC